MKKSFKKKALALALVCAMSCGTASLVKEKQVNDAQAWAGLSYAVAKKGGSAEASLFVGVVGAVDASIQGAAWGAAFGGVVGACVGIGVGL